MRTWLIVVGLLASCSSDHTDGWDFDEPLPQPDAGLDTTPEPDLPGPTTRFEGWWRVDQPNHAGYEATAYHFRDDGSLVEGESQGFGSGQIPVGRVAQCLDAPDGQCAEFGVECLFGDRWRADGDALTIAGVCADDQPRDIVLTFQAGEAISLEPHVDVVPGEFWMHNDFQWSWTRCDSEVSCLTW